MSDANDERAGAPGERREAARIPVEMWVEESTERELYFQRSSNLSTGGLYLEKTVPHPKGTLVNLRFTLPGGSVPIEVRGEIVNPVAADELGMGVKFVDLKPDDQRRIAEFVSQGTTARP